MRNEKDEKKSFFDHNKKFWRKKTFFCSQFH
jgi:hypothetical protein